MRVKSLLAAKPRRALTRQCSSCHPTSLPATLETMRRTAAVLSLVVGMGCGAALAAPSLGNVPRRVTVAVSVTGNGKVVSIPPGISCPRKCRATFSTKAKVRLSAKASKGWEFRRWTGVCRATRAAACSYRTSKATTIRAVFERKAAAPTPPPPPPPLPPAPPPAPAPAPPVTLVPIGTAVPIATPQTPVGWTLRVNWVTPDATSQVLASSSGHFSPTAGHQFFLVSITATYTGFVSADPGEVLAELDAIGASNQPYTHRLHDSCGALPASDFRRFVGVPIYNGSSVFGNVCWSVLSSDASSLAMYTSEAPRVWFALH